MRREENDSMFSLVYEGKTFVVHHEVLRNRSKHDRFRGLHPWCAVDDHGRREKVAKQLFAELYRIRDAAYMHFDIRHRWKRVSIGDFASHQRRSCATKDFCRRLLSSVQ